MPLYKSKLKGSGDTITPWQKTFRALNPLGCGHASLLGASSGISIQCCYMQAASMLWHPLTPASTKISNNRVRRSVSCVSSTGFVELVNWADTNEKKIILCKASLPGVFLLVCFWGLFTDRINQYKLRLLPFLPHIVCSHPFLCTHTSALCNWAMKKFRELSCNENRQIWWEHI